MNMSLEKLYPYLERDNYGDDWRLKKEAPEWAQKLFQEYQDAEDERLGFIIDGKFVSHTEFNKHPEKYLSKEDYQRFLAQKKIIGE